jgi:hypothetical protein
VITTEPRIRPCSSIVSHSTECCAICMPRFSSAALHSSNRSRSCCYPSGNALGVIDASISHYCNLEGCGCVVERGGRPTRPGPRAKIMHWVCFFISQNTTYMYTSMFSAHACLQQTCKSRQERAGWQGRVPCSRETVHTASRPLKAGDGALVRGGADLRLHGILLRKHLTLSAMRRGIPLHAAHVGCLTHLPDPWADYSTYISLLLVSVFQITRLI